MMAERTRTITALQAQKRNRQRVNVYLDGEFAFGLARIVAAWLKVGQVLSQEKIEELQTKDAQEAAYQQALRILSYRDRSHAEIAANLKEHGYEPAIISQVLQRLKDRGLADDQRFARVWTENRSEFRPRSRRMLAYELRQKGLADDEIDRALTGLDDAELAFQAAQKQARKLRDLAWPDFRQKMVGFLARRGFNYEISAESAARSWAELHELNKNEISEGEVE